MGAEDLREELRQALSRVESLGDLASHEAKAREKAMEFVHSARIRLQNVQAIRHLARHMREALGANAEPNVDICLMEAIKDLDRAAEEANVVPF